MSGLCPHVREEGQERFSVVYDIYLIKLKHINVQFLVLKNVAFCPKNTICGLNSLEHNEFDFKSQHVFLGLVYWHTWNNFLSQHRFELCHSYCSPTIHIFSTADSGDLTGASVCHQLSLKKKQNKKT